MNKAIEEKLARIQELVSQRNAIDSQLEELLGVSEGIPESKVIVVPYTKKMGRPRGSVTQSGKGLSGRFPPKPCCGSTGPRHMKGCKYGSTSALPVNNGSLPEDERRIGAMTQKQFAQVKISQEHDLPSDVVARELGLSKKEVERAIVAKAYADYCKKL